VVLVILFVIGYPLYELSANRGRPIYNIIGVELYSDECNKFFMTIIITKPLDFPRVLLYYRYISNANR
jgi:hypothetical protein